MWVLPFYYIYMYIFNWKIWKYILVYFSIQLKIILSAHWMNNQIGSIPTANFSQTLLFNLILNCWLFFLKGVPFYFLTSYCRGEITCFETLLRKHLKLFFPKPKCFLDSHLKIYDIWEHNRKTDVCVYNLFIIAGFTKIFISVLLHI